jgi:sigma-54-specific transcriptional regulator
MAVPILTDPSNALPANPRLVLEHPASIELLARLARLAASDAPVLLMGETGTGKELFAREIHARSPRVAKAFVAVNAGALSEQLIESELFGHEKGAFTGAHERKAGWFEAADGGTLFLDEIGDLPLGLQVKLLRVLSTGEVTRVGSRSSTRVDVRLVAATNVDLRAAMRERRFREDLFYRLSVTTLRLPPLRERRGDILPIARHLLQRFGAGRAGLELGADAQAALLAHDWPGNVRELENVMQQAVIECRGTLLSPADLGLATSDGSVTETLDAAPATERSAERPEAREVPAAKLVSAAPRPLSVAAAVHPFPGSDARHVPGSLDRAELHALPGLARRFEPASIAAAWSSLEQALDELVASGMPDLHARVDSAVLLAAFRRASHNQLETARLLGLSRHVVRARLLEHGYLAAGGRRGGRGSAPQSTTGRVLRIGYQNLGLLTLVKAFGAYDAALRARGVMLRWQEYAGGIQIVDALARGELDVGVVGDCPAVCAQAEEVPVVYVAAEPPAPRGAALIVPRGSKLRSVRDLRGKRVAVNRAAQAHYLLMLALEEEGLGLDDIELRFEAPAIALAEFQSGGIDAWAIWDPWLSSAQLDLGARVLRDTSGLFDSSVYYLAHEHFAQTDADLVAELRLHLELAARWVESDPGRAASLVAPHLGFSARALVASLDRQLCRIGITPGQIAAQQHIADQCLRLRLIPRSVSVAAAQWPQALAG